MLRHLTLVLALLGSAAVATAQAEKTPAEIASVAELGSEDGSPSLRVWPLPQSQDCRATVGGEAPIALATGWAFSPPAGPGGAKCTSSVVSAALTRYMPILGAGSPLAR